MKADDNRSDELRANQELLVKANDRISLLEEYVLALEEDLAAAKGAANELEAENSLLKDSVKFLSRNRIPRGETGTQTADGVGPLASSARSEGE